MTMAVSQRNHVNYEDYMFAVDQIISPSSDPESIDQLILVLKDATNTKRTATLFQALSEYSDSRETDIERIGLTRHEEFLGSVNQLQRIREDTLVLTDEILNLNQSIQSSTEKLAEQKQALVNTRAIRQNIIDASDALRESLSILHAVNQAHDLVRKKKYYAALKSLDDLQNEHLLPTIQNKYATQQKLADIIQKSIPVSQKLISEAVMTDLNTWLFRIRETSQFLGEVAFYHTELRRTRQRKRVDEDNFMSNFKLNSAIGLVSDESEEFDVIDNEELQVDFTPLFECLHIYEALGQSDKFRSEYSATRRQQKDLLLPTSVSLLEDDEASLSSLLEGIAGFAIIEKATMRRAPQLRSAVDVEELWDSMCQAAVHLTSKALNDITDAEVLLKIKGFISLFIQTMEGWGYSVSMLDTFLLALFSKYAELLKRRFSEDFQEIVSTDDYMPMTIQSEGEYEKVVNVSWFAQEKPISELSFPCVLPFSQMYPLCCIDIRNFLNQFYFFSDDHFQHPNTIDETLRKALDELLVDKVCKSLVERLSSQYLGQIVQILINLEHFERIFELVNSKIDDLVDTSEYDWLAIAAPTETSGYMHTLTVYLENIMNSTLLGLPREIKELIYFDALSHAANKILALPLSPEVKHINPHGVAALAKDVQYLTAFVDHLENGEMLKENLDELQQTINLMQSDNHDEFFDVSTRNKKYGRVDAMNGPILLEKLTSTVQGPSRAAALANFSSRFGMK
ncbi:unnamed protein product [Parascedosporium putredinis]|uniref:Exocyst complex component SEC15 n=1 Tax=Parascedosporium putredinis TaxID=1442378 RepID=A0A9P1M8A0_9PEZI|nr:unnamed protein product [Parascedosporium putredinis]CAI7988523.1 unnamed protein product [Parascedosporium putredinis]